MARRRVSPLRTLVSRREPLMEHRTNEEEIHRGWRGNDVLWPFLGEAFVGQQTQCLMFLIVESYEKPRHHLIRY